MKTFCILALFNSPLGNVNEKCKRSIYMYKGFLPKNEYITLIYVLLSLGSYLMLEGFTAGCAGPKVDPVV